MNETDDITFQISDWDFYHEEDDEGDLTIQKYVIRLYGTTKDGKKVYTKVDGFTPFFYVEIPKEWRNSTVTAFVEELKRRVHPDQQSALKSFDIVDRHKFYGFTNYKFYNFVRLVFHSYDGFRAFSRALNRKIFNRQLSPKPVKYNQYESNLEPMLRFMHIRNIRACGWVTIPAGKYKLHTGKEAMSYNDIDISTNWSNINPAEDENISKIIVASFDIECTSEDGVSFPQPNKDGDKIIQIGTTFNYYGDPECFYKHIITLGSCDKIEGVDVESYNTEHELLLAWVKLIRKMNPDVLTGYNIFGFDYSYIEARAKKLGIHKKFTLLGRLKNVNSEYTTKDLSSSALGKNILYYYKMHGRVQIDLMKVVMRDHRLSSYKLDSVASEFIREQVTKDTKVVDNKYTIINTKSTYGLSKERYIKIFYNDGLSDTSYKDGKKFKVIDLTSNTLTIDGVLDEEAMMFDKYKIFWCQAKDDVSPTDIFRLQKGTSTDRATIAKYCIQDCVLVNKLMEKLQILTNNIGMSNVCYVPLAYIFLRGQGIKVFSLVSKKCREKNHVIPVLQKKFKPQNGTQETNKKPTVVTLEDRLFGKHDEEEEEDDPEGYEGATVLKPQKGVHFSPIPVLDYASLYPSSMIHRNISHECLVQDKQYDNLDGYIYYSVTFYNNDGSSTTSKYAKRKDGAIGIIPEILQDLLTARKNTRAKQETEKDPFKFKILEGLQLAFKLTANSLYGQTGAPTSSIYLRDIAASTTATGREMLNAARLFAQHLFTSIVKSALFEDYKSYEQKIRLLFTKQNDKLIEPELLKKLKTTHYKDNDDPNDKSYLSKPVDYYYLRVFQERFEALTDNDFINKRMGHTSMNDFIKYFYDEARSALEGLDIDPFCVYGDTDSIFVDFGIKDINTGTKLTDHHGLKTGIRLGVLCGNLINKVLPKPQNLTYEKTFWPWIILTKKRYVGNLYEFDPNKYYQKSMGIVLKRRDNAPIVKIVVGGIVKSILNDRSPKKAAEFTKSTLKDILSGKYPLDKFIITKTLKGTSMTIEEQKKEALKPKEERIYADRSSIVHAVLADRMAERDPGNRPQSNDRIPYVYKIIKGKPKLQGDRVETPEYLVEHGEKIDYLFYITNQIMKPSVQFLEHVIQDPEKIFEDHILREENRRKGLRPISSFFESNVESEEDNDDSENSNRKFKLNNYDESMELEDSDDKTIKFDNDSDSDELIKSTESNNSIKKIVKPVIKPTVKPTVKPTNEKLKKKTVSKKIVKPELKKTTKLGGFSLDL